jgi:Tfp pilus assembly protein PilV
MSELKRNTDFTAGNAAARTAQNAAGIDESQPWRTAEMQAEMERWAVSADAGFDPYNHVGNRAKKPHAA